MAGLLGLGLNEAAYMAEIVRAGIDVGRPGPAARRPRALGMSAGADPAPDRAAAGDAGDHPADRQRDDLDAQDHLAGRRRPGHLELFSQLQAIAPRTFQPIPLLIVAVLWYLALTSVLMVGQYYVERYFARGRSAPDRRRPARRRRLSAHGH